MEDLQSGPCGPALYVLSERAYEELRDAQDMLQIMAQLTYGDEDGKHGVAMLRIPRVTLQLVFEQISARIGDALGQLGFENDVNERWQGWR